MGVQIQYKTIYTRTENSLRKAELCLTPWFHPSLHIHAFRVSHDSALLQLCIASSTSKSQGEHCLELVLLLGAPHLQKVGQVTLLQQELQYICMALLWSRALSCSPVTAVVIASGRTCPATSECTTRLWACLHHLPWELCTKLTSSSNSRLTWADSGAMKSWATLMLWPLLPFTTWWAQPAGMTTTSPCKAVLAFQAIESRFVWLASSALAILLYMHQLCTDSLFRAMYMAYEVSSLWNSQLQSHVATLLPSCVLSLCCRHYFPSRHDGRWLLAMMQWNNFILASACIRTPMARRGKRTADWMNSQGLTLYGGSASLEKSFLSRTRWFSGFQRRSTPSHTSPPYLSFRYCIKPVTIQPWRHRRAVLI